MKLGHAKKVRIQMSGPVEYEDFEIDLNNLTLFTGKNGVGKSLVMKIIWVMGMVGNVIIKKHTNLKEATQYIFDKSIPDTETFASLRMEFESGASINIGLQAGKVLLVEGAGFEKITELQSCIYMSSEMRTFNSMKGYLTLRKIVGVDKTDEHHKLYDILYVEGLIQKMPITFDKEIKEKLKTFEGIHIPDSVVFEDNDFLGIFDGEKKSLSSLGSGDQSILNMTIGSL